MFTIKSLGAGLDAWVREQVTVGRFKSEDEVFFEAMRLFRETMENPEVGKAVLRAQIQAGIDSGPGRPAEEFFAETLNRNRTSNAA
jgi:antitoxin ParD1/3/4